MSDEKDKKEQDQVEETTAEETTTEQPPKPKAPRKKKEPIDAAKQEESMAKLQKDYQDLNDRYMRMLAEYDNFRKRSAADGERQKLAGITYTLSAVFPVIDSINRAIEVLKEDDAALAGIQQIKKQFEAAMAKMGVEQIPALGEEFNPEYHNAVMQEENAEQAGKVIAVFQEGYKYKDYVIRPSMVKVAV